MTVPQKIVRASDEAGGVAEGAGHQDRSPIAMAGVDLQESAMGVYFLNSVFSDIDSLVLYAGIHPMKFGFHRMLCQRFPYAVYYSVDGITVSVWRVLDLRRDPTWIANQFE